MPWILIGPAAGAAGIAIGPEVLVAGLLLLGLAITAKVWLEPLVASLKNGKHGGLLHVVDLVTAPLRHAAASAVSAVSHSISVAAMHRMQPVARFLHALGSLVLGWAWGLRTAIGDLTWSIERLATVVLPREIREATAPLRHRVSRAAAAAAAAALAARHLRAYLNRLYGHTIRPALHHLAHAVDVTIPRALGRLGQRTRALERDLAHPRKAWLRRIAAGMWAAFLAGAFVRALAKRFPWLFCRKVKTVGNRLCGLDPDLLDGLLLGTLLIATPISVQEMARELQGIEHEAVQILGGFIQEL